MLSWKKKKVGILTESVWSNKMGSGCEPRKVREVWYYVVLVGLAVTKASTL